MPDHRSKTAPPSNQNELAITVAKIDDRTRLMIDRYLPSIEATAHEARDGVVELKSRVATLEGIPPTVPHECDEKERQQRQDEKIQDAKASIGSLASFRSWLIGIIVVVVFSAGSFAVFSRTADTSAAERISSNRADIDRHESIISDLPRKADLDRVSQAVNKIPGRVVDLQIPPATVDEIEEATSRLPLKDGEMRAIISILAKARERTAAAE